MYHQIHTHLCKFGILYIKGRRGRNETFHPSVRPVIRSIIHPWMASYNNPLQCEG
jgi:hypothetical protein